MLFEEEANLIMCFKKLSASKVMYFIGTSKFWRVKEVEEGVFPCPLCDNLVVLNPLQRADCEVLMALPDYLTSSAPNNLRAFKCQRIIFITGFHLQEIVLCQLWVHEEIILAKAESESKAKGFLKVVDFDINKTV